LAAMGRVAMVAIGALLAIAAGAAQTTSVATRTYDGTGSLDASKPIHVYLLDGTYRHRLMGSIECYTTASVFPNRDRPGLLLGEVLDADISVGRRSSGEGAVDPAGDFDISQPGWAWIQVGTGPECAWTYSITGRFLAEGDEPALPSERSLWWLQIVAVATIASLILLAVRRRSAPAEDEESPIRVMEP